MIRALTADSGLALPAPEKRQLAQDAQDHDVDLSALDVLLGYNLRRASAKQRERFRAVFDAYDVRPVQLSVLILLRHNMPIRQAELGRALEMKRANVVTTLDELIERGLVSRRPAEENRRFNMVSLTDKGIRMTDELLAAHERLEQDLARAFGKKRLADLVDLLRAFRQLEP